MLAAGRCSPGPASCSQTVDISIIDQAEKQVGNARFWLIDRNDIVEEVGHFVALLDQHSRGPRFLLAVKLAAFNLHLLPFFFAGEASDFAVTLFDGRGQVKNVVREGKGVWGDELNADATIA